MKKKVNPINYAPSFVEDIDPNKKHEFIVNETLSSFQIPLPDYSDDNNDKVTISVS